MLGWLLIALALAVLFVYPGLGGLIVVAGAVLWYLLTRSRERRGERRSGVGPEDGGVPPRSGGGEAQREEGGAPPRPDDGEPSGGEGA